MTLGIDSDDGGTEDCCDDSGAGVEVVGSVKDSDGWQEVSESGWHGVQL